MPSPLAHFVAGASLWPVFGPGNGPRRTWIWGGGLAMLPDIDFTGLLLGVPYESPFGHRGITHSFLFAGVAAVLLWRVLSVRSASRPGASLLPFLVLAAVSHMLLDAMTNGGLGVAFLAPFDVTRYFLPFRPILVSPLRLDRFLSPIGLAVMRNELLWVGLPAAAIAGIGWVRRASTRSTPTR